MYTIVETMPYENPDSAGLAPVPRSQDEIDLMSAEELLFCYEAGHGLLEDKWLSRNGAPPLVMERTLMPLLQPALDAYHGQPSALFPNGNYQLTCPGIMVPGEGSLNFVGRTGPNDNAFIIGLSSPGRSDVSQLVWSGADASDGSLSFSVNGGGLAGAYGVLPTSRKFADGPCVVSVDWRPQPLENAGNQLRIRRIHLASGAVEEVFADTAGGAIGNAHTNLHIGGVNVDGAAVGGALQNGDIGGIWGFNKALHFNPATDELFLRYVRSKFAIPIP